jgi:dihydrofolate synthase / folylpolyglutamate synthase
MRSAADHVSWVEGLSPWPEAFGLGRMLELLGALGDPQHAFPAIHVVGTNGKTTTARMTEAVLQAEGLRAGTYTSPHVTGWAERIRVGGEEVDIERALGRARSEAERLGATQFEALTAAALAEFAAAEVDVAVVEAGLGGRLDATNVLRAPVVVLTNVELEHTDVLGETREAIAAEKLAVLAPGATAVLGEPEWEELARRSGAGRVVVTGRSNVALAVAAPEAFLGRAVDSHPAEHGDLPGRLERVAEAPLEIWDGAHNLAAVGHLLARLPRADYVVVASILRDKDARGMLAALSALGGHLIATSSRNDRALPARGLARLAQSYFPRVQAIGDPEEAVLRARETAKPEGAVLVTGSLYLLAELAPIRTSALPWQA